MSTDLTLYNEILSTCIISLHIQQHLVELIFIYYYLFHIYKYSLFYKFTINIREKQIYRDIYC